MTTICFVLIYSSSMDDFMADEGINIGSHITQNLRCLENPVCYI
jgi:hypothetical protein